MKKKIPQNIPVDLSDLIFPADSAQQTEWALIMIADQCFEWEQQSTTEEEVG